MGLTKANAIDQLQGPNSISNQEALVKKIQGTKIKEPVRHVIPGGKNLTDLDQGQLPVAVFNWLRHCRHFTEGVISLCADYTERNTKTKRVVDFDPKQRNTEWEIRGKRWLAERVADVLTEDNILAVKIEKEGLYAVYDNEGEFTSESSDWEPYVELTPFRAPTF